MNEPLKDFFETMEAIKDVMAGARPKPGGTICAFPYCACELPWEECERKLTSHR